MYDKSMKRTPDDCFKIIDGDVKVTISLYTDGELIYSHQYARISFFQAYDLYSKYENWYEKRKHYKVEGIGDNTYRFSKDGEEIVFAIEEIAVLKSSILSYDLDLEIRMFNIADHLCLEKCADRLYLVEHAEVVQND